ncbi:MAG TPA: glycoside hydrolase family 3 N-terminal domain-containing protein, partial [Microthrixaceae bacterium]|nr:glycoside hydrolase family 3 N-terminal domain-containing protein [Microthrixaceae bacterium]
MTIACLVTACVLAACTGTSKSQVEVQAPTTNPKAPPTTRAADCAEILPPSAQAGQLLMVMVTAPGLAKETLNTATAGGFGLKGRQSSDVKTEIKDAVSTAPLTPFVASDEEGGSVQRFEAALGPLPSAAKMAKGTPQAAGTTIGEYSTKMVGIGANMNFAPVADVGSGSGLGTRTFGDDPAVVSDFVTASVKAQQDAGLIAVVKHWPGIGGGGTDPHDSLDKIAPLGELGQKDLIPFNAAIAAGVQGVMVAHVEVPGLTEPGVPASLSPAAITGELRGREKFNGLVITDSLGMGAIVNTVSQEEAAEKAIT